jgi:ketosteroid isomerase-like protein
VAVEVRGEGLRLNGKRYQNRYTFILGFDADQRICEVREYCDTLHAFDVYDLDVPRASPSSSA